MADLEWHDEAPEPAALRRAARVALRRLAPGLRILTEDFLAEASPIDLLAVSARGELVAIRIAGDDAGDEREVALQFTRSLSDLSWLSRRGGDLARLAPELGLTPEAAPRALLLAAAIPAEVRSAAALLGDVAIELASYRCVRQQGQLTLWIELEKSALVAARPEAERPAARAEPPSPPGLADPPSHSAFRTGLRDADLRSARTHDVPGDAADSSPTAPREAAPAI